MKGNTKYITAGFALVFALIIGVSAIAISHMMEINNRLEAIVKEHNAKADLVFAMRHNARERLIILHAMAVTNDLFEHDDFYKRFLQYAARFTENRMKLTAMQLSDQERRVLAAQSQLTQVAFPLQEQFVDMVMAGKNSAANRFFIEKVLPAQNRVLGQLDELLSLQRDASYRASEEASRSFRSAFLFMAALGAAALLLGIVIAWLVVHMVARAQDELFHEKELAQVTLHSIGDAVITTDADGNIDYLNPIAERLTGWEADKARGQPLRNVFQVVHESSREPVEILASDYLLDGPAVSAEQRILLISRWNEEFAIENSLAPIRNGEGKTIGLVLVFRDVTQSRFLAQQLRWQASHDALTGLDNRHEFERRLGKMIESAEAQGKTHALLYMDLDQFKVVNDTCGHIAGDELLRQLANTLRDKIRENDVLARLGGDEFGILLEGCPLDQAMRIAEGLREAVHGFHFVWLDQSFDIGASIGVVPIDSQSETLEKILSTADAACYAAKDGGRNRVHIYRPDDRDLVRRHGEMQWLTRINKAFEEDRFRLYYQTITQIKSGLGPQEHYEVLLAMADEAGNITPPMAFIPAAERYGVMPAIDRWVIRHIFEKHLPLWRDKLARCRHGECDLMLAINISGMSINDDYFLDFLREQIANHGVPPQALCFEITETAAITNLGKASRFMRELHALGCHFALDDFGSGMSSFTYLKNLPVDYLKIDGAFVKDMAHDRVDYAMVEAINRIGHILGIQTIAESVESAAILERLKTLGVDYGQGYHIHRPQLFEDLALVRGAGTRRVQA